MKLYVSLLLFIGLGVFSRAAFASDVDERLDKIEERLNLITQKIMGTGLEKSEEGFIPSSSTWFSPSEHCPTIKNNENEFSHILVRDTSFIVRKRIKCDGQEYLLIQPPDARLLGARYVMVNRNAVVLFQPNKEPQK